MPAIDQISDAQAQAAADQTTDQVAEQPVLQKGVAELLLRCNGWAEMMEQLDEWQDFLAEAGPIHFLPESVLACIWSAFFDCWRLASLPKEDNAFADMEWLRLSDKILLQLNLVAPAILNQEMEMGSLVLYFDNKASHLLKSDTPFFAEWERDHITFMQFAARFSGCSHHKNGALWQHVFVLWASALYRDCPDADATMEFVQRLQVIIYHMSGTRPKALKALPIPVLIKLGDWQLPPPKL